MNRLSLAAFCTLLSLPLWATAEEPNPPDSTDIAEGTYAKPIEKTAPDYPRSALRLGQEGWVLISYVIGTDGKVYDPIVEDSSGIGAFERAATQVVEKWRFEPATWGGKPIEQSQTKTYVTFAIERPNDQRGASRRFISRDKKFNRYLEEGDLVAAEKLLTETFEKSGWNLYETTRLWISSYRLHAARSDEPNQLKSINRAAGGREFVGANEAADILVIQFLLQARLGRYADAIDTYETLVEEAPTVAEDDGLVRASKSIYEFLKSDKAIASDALIEGSAGNGVWAHRLARRKFAIDSLDGEIENLDIRCDWYRARDDGPYLETTWEIPPHMGNCRLFVHGHVGTSFRLLEMPDSETSFDAGSGTVENGTQ